MKTVKDIVNHPLSKAIALGIIGTALLLEKHPLYAGIAIGMGIREFLLAFKSE
mgnify:CR=1 FL=1|tara:strand:- start:36 stop:194 length:159 start_codon:yes stop_codon:yes gene_type:complete